MSQLSPTLESVWRTFTRSAEPVRIFNSTAILHVSGFHFTTSDIVYDVQHK
jgi:hypothetical protein